MLIKGFITQTKEAGAFASIYVSDKDGNNIDVAGTMADERGYYELDLSNKLENTEFITIGYLDTKKTMPFDDFDCGGSICSNDFELSGGGFLDAVTVTYIKSFWEKHKTHILIAGGVIVAAIIGIIIYKGRK